MGLWFRLPVLVRGALIVVLWVGYGNLVLHLVDERRVMDMAMVFVYVCVFASLMTIRVDMAVLRKFGSRDRLNAYRRALRDGAAPLDAKHTEWRTWLRTGAGGSVVGAICLGPFLYYGFTSSINSHVPLRWLPATAFALCSMGVVVALCVHLRRISHVLSDLKRRPPAQVDVPSVEGVVKKEVSYLEGIAEEAFGASLPHRLTMSFVSIFVSASAVLFLVDLPALVYGGASVIRLSWALALAGAMGVTAAALSQERHLRRNFDSYAEYEDYRRTVRTGAMPERVDPDLWQRRLQMTAVENLLRPLSAAFLVGVGAACVVSSRHPYLLLLATLYQGTAMWLVLLWWRTRIRLAFLREQVEARRSAFLD